MAAPATGQAPSADISKTNLDPTDLSESDDTIQTNSDPEKATVSGPDAEAGRPKPAAHVPPNGGILAWIQVAASFAIFFNTWGVLNTFGVFQTYYETGVLFEQTSSNISWIGSIQAYCVLVVGIVAGPIYDRGYFRQLLVVGSFLIVFGFMMLSLCNAYWQAILAQGFCIGIGAGLIFIPSLAILPAYFSSRLGLAIGLAACGSSFGGVIYPIVFYRLLNEVGFEWAVRAVGFIALATLMVPVFFMRMGVRPVRPRAIFDWSAFTDWPFVLFVLFTMLGFIGLYVMLFYISYFAFATQIATAEMSFYLVPILNVASMLGRTLPNALSDKTGPMNILAPGAIICAALTYAMIGVNSLAGIVVITILYGFFSGVFIALPPVCFVRLTADKSKVGTRMGMGFAILGFGVLTGGPGGGAILGTDFTNLHWTSLWVYGGTVTLGGGVLLLALRGWLSGWKLLAKI
ncbi:putative monocarboxylate transporter [Lasiosphaeris hirsuta]|uniref:Monocarboxylate transporter n=1 Tax=Lasiosphaeris hirsuta TaxID=260670 RepID=A0AA40E3M2_9PEZI|nr:putative monocarboxylate transporter [Lasiosphaeris hirsuta]